MKNLKILSIMLTILMIPLMVSCGDNDEKDKAGRYIRRERYSGSVSRTFYVGDEIKQQDIHGKFEDGILCLCIPKKDAKTIEENKYISIE